MAKYRVYLDAEFNIVSKEQATQIKEVDGDAVRFLQVDNSSANTMKADGSHWVTVNGKHVLIEHNDSKVEIGKKLSGDYVYHNTSEESLNSIEKEGMSAGSFSDKPIDFGGDKWIAVHKKDLPNAERGGAAASHQYGNVIAHEPVYQQGYDDKGDPINPAHIPPHRIYEVDKKGRVLRKLGNKMKSDSHLMKWDDTRPLTEAEMNLLSNVTIEQLEQVKLDIHPTIRDLLNAQLD